MNARMRREDLLHHVEDGVRQSVGIIRNHPLLPRDVPVHGLIIHPETGKLDVLVEGYRQTAEGVASHNS